MYNYSYHVRYSNTEEYQYALAQACHVSDKNIFIQINECLDQLYKELDNLSLPWFKFICNQTLKQYPSSLIVCPALQLPFKAPPFLYLGTLPVLFIWFNFLVPIFASYSAWSF